MISADFLAELDRFDPRDRRARSRRRGERTTDAVGEGLTFADYRRYVPGDEPRFIDWNLYARTDDLYVKQFEAERSHTVHVLVDASASMGFGGVRQAGGLASNPEGQSTSGDGAANKFEYAAKLGLGFAYLTAREYNEFRFSLLGETTDRLDRGRSNRGEVLALVDRCNAVEPDGEAAFEPALGEYAGRIGSKALVVVCSDFLCDPAAVESGLDALSSNRLVLAHVVAPGERSLPGRGDTVFEALESDRSTRTYVGRRLERRYRDRFDDHASEIERIARDLRARYRRIDTDRSVFDSFGELWRA